MLHQALHHMVKHEAQRSPDSDTIHKLSRALPPLIQALVSMSTAPHLVTLALAKHIAVLLERAAGELGLVPQAGSEEAVGVGDSDEGGLEGVLEGLGRTGRRGVNVFDTAELQQTLDGGRGDQAGTTGSRDELCVVSMLLLF